MSIVARKPDVDFWAAQESRLADRFIRHILRTGPICTTKNSLPDTLPPSPGEREMEQCNHETDILYSQDR